MPISKFIPQHFISNFKNIKKSGYFVTTGYVMFADLSGFTAMSEKLSKKGIEGSEEISKILNTIFEDMIGIILNTGGSVYKFGGDALTVFFPEKIKPQEVLASGILLVSAMDKYSEIKSIGGKVKVEIKVGTAYGKTIIGQLGDKDKDYFIAGDTLDAACDCEHHAGKGESIIHRSFVDKLASSKTKMTPLKNKSGDYFLAPNKKLKLSSHNDTKIITEITEELNPFTRDILLSKERAGEIEKGELRNCTVLFMSFTGITYDNNFMYDLLNKFVINVYNISAKYSGFVNKVDMGDKGSKIIVLFGAPIATEKNEEYAGRCAMEIIDTLPLGMKVKVGINSGNIYFGIIGSSMRLEFTVIGNAVNLSARLMTSCAENEIIISDGIKNKIEGVNTINSRGLKLKGIKDLFLVHTIESITGKQSSYIKAVGRDTEISQYKKYLKDKKITLINIKAEAGLGKSVLAGEFARIVSLKSDVIKSECLSYTSENPFYTIKDIITGMIGESANSPADIKIKKIEKLLKKINEEHNIDIYLSFLGLDKGRKIKLDESMKNVFIDITQSIFIELTSKKQFYIFIEDIHWIDNDSNELLKSLVEITANSQCLWHFIYRPDDKLSFFEKLLFSKVIEPDNFSKEAAKEYIIKKFHLKTLPAKLYDNIYSKAKGNPFYMDEIIISIREKNGLLKESDGSFSIKPGYINFEIPENINEIILARIDQIDDNSKRILKIASVIGRIFQINILNQLRDLQEKATTLNLRSQLFDLSLMDFTMFELNNDNEYLFKHVITRDVIYETLLFSIRRKYHAEIANIYEENAGDNIKSLYELLAFHYKLAKERSKAKEYLFLSSEKAEQNFSYPQAIKFLKDYRKFKTTNEEKAISLLREAAILKILEKRDQAIKICDKVKSMFDKKDLFYIKASVQKTSILLKSNRFEDIIAEIIKLGKIDDTDLYAESLAYLMYGQLLTGKIRKAANTT
ncbi:MAG: AAA family ATPase, partial [Candidatus Delongbacteria bacterium]|nr:AAA family ATPase [Candidatus Delongbacteria bacterium]MCG2761340.1 AAA family ATPase [Candidatus Delongbacteria bacterium]